MIAVYPILNQSNNGILSSQKAMPLKSLTSANDSDFSINRRAYVESHMANTAPLVKNDQHSMTQGTVNNAQFGNRGFLNINHNFTGQASTVQKKWIGGNRDASNIVSRRRINSVGNGSLNAAAGPMSFNTVKDTNTERQAYHRVRSGGSAVPAKCTHKYPNAPIFS